MFGKIFAFHVTGLSLMILSAVFTSSYNCPMYGGYCNPVIFGVELNGTLHEYIGVYFLFGTALSGFFWLLIQAQKEVLKK